MIGMASAVQFIPQKNTTVSGIIWNEGHTARVEGANVEVTCNGYNETAVSASDGVYGVEFDNSVITQCSEEDTAFVTAMKDGSVGTGNGIVHDFGLTVNLAVIIVTVPEFGFFIGGLTILSAVGVFFLVRRE